MRLDDTTDEETLPTTMPDTLVITVADIHDASGDPVPLWRVHAAPYDYTIVETHYENSVGGLPHLTITLARVRQEVSPHAP